MAQTTEQARFSAFLSGHWQKKMPKKSGVYFICPRDGVPGVEYRVVYEHNGELRSTRGWSGWWWSEPWPELPPPPKWEAEAQEEPKPTSPPGRGWSRGDPRYALPEDGKFVAAEANGITLMEGVIEAGLITIERPNGERFLIHRGQAWPDHLWWARKPMTR